MNITGFHPANNAAKQALNELMREDPDLVVDEEDRRQSVSVLRGMGLAFAHDKELEYSIDIRPGYRAYSVGLKKKEVKVG